MAKENILNVADLRGKSADQLNDLLTAAKKEAFNLRFQLKNGELEKTHRIHDVKTNVAKISTVISEQRLGLTFDAAKKETKKAAPKKAAKKTTEAKKEDK